MSRGFSLAAIVGLALTVGCAGLPVSADGRREVTVEAEGLVPATGENLATIQQRALAEAQKKAVEKAVGVTLRATTRVDDAINVRQSIEANLGGSIRRYEILSQGVDGATYRVRIRAVVLYIPPNAPGILKSTVFSVRLAPERVASAIRSTLTDWDYASESEGRADVVVSGVVKTYGVADPRLGGFYSYRASATLSVLDTRTGRLTETTAESSAADIDDRSAYEMALDGVGQAAGLAVASIYASTPAVTASLLPGAP